MALKGIFYLTNSRSFFAPLFTALLHFTKIEILYNGHLGNRRNWPLKRGGRCRKVLNKSQCMVSLSPWTKKSGGCREVAVIAEVRLYIKAWRNRLQWKPATVVCFSFPSHCIDATRCIYIFPCFWKSTPPLKFDWIFWNMVVWRNDYRFCTHFSFARVICTVSKQSIAAFKANMAYIPFADSTSKVGRSYQTL